VEWLAILAPPAIWLKAVWATPYLKVHRNGVSLALSILSGVLAFAALKLSDLVLFIGLGAATGAMLFAMLMPPANVAAGSQAAARSKDR
jgi:hypothetical protein